jgi:hypothetical protein
LYLFATESFFLDQAHQKALEALSKGAYKKGHPVITDTEKANAKDEVPFYNQPTHGKGPVDNPSEPLSDSTDLQGNNSPQNAVYLPDKCSFPRDWSGPSFC